MEAVDAEGDAFPRNTIGTHAVECGYHAPTPAKKLVGQSNKTTVGYSGVRGAPQCLGDRMFGSLGVQGTQGDERRRR